MARAIKTTIEYWLGLNLIADKTWAAAGSHPGRAAAVFRLGGDEYGADPASDGWSIYAPAGGKIKRRTLLVQPLKMV